MKIYCLAGDYLWSLLQTAKTAYCIYWNNWNAEITEMASIQGVLYLLKQAFTEMSYCIYWNNWNELLYLLK